MAAVKVIEQAFDVAGLVFRKPRTLDELQDLHSSAKRCTLHRYLKLLIAEGLVVKTGRGVNRNPFVYQWVRSAQQTESHVPHERTAPDSWREYV